MDDLSSPDTHAEMTIEALDKEILQLRRAMHALQRKRNALLPVARLPSEVLTEVFLYVVLQDHNSGRPGVWVNYAFSQTSHHLRKVALACPLLWSFLFARTPALTGEMLRRSRDCALQVVATKSRLELHFPTPAWMSGLKMPSWISWGRNNTFRSDWPCVVFEPPLVGSSSSFELSVLMVMSEKPKKEYQA
jgi:hypothetical protein